MAKHKIKAEKHDSITVIIPAAGEGRRMKSYGPKPLIQLTKGTILDRQIRLIDKVLGPVDFIIVAGFECDKLMDSCPERFIKVENEFNHLYVRRSPIVRKKILLNCSPKLVCPTIGKKPRKNLLPYCTMRTTLSLPTNDVIATLHADKDISYSSSSCWFFFFDVMFFVIYF